MPLQILQNILEFKNENNGVKETISRGCEVKQYYIKERVLGSEVPVVLAATTLEDAKDEVRDVWANGGKKTLVCVTYQKVKEKEYIIDTDY